MPQNKAASKGRATVDSLLDNMIRRIERQPGRTRRVAEKMPAVSLLADDLDDLMERIKAAEHAGAIETKKGRYENRHNIEQLILKDVDALYRFLGRDRPALGASAARREIDHYIHPLVPELASVLDQIENDWSRGQKVMRDLAPADAMIVAGCLRAAGGLISGSYEGVDLRTFSVRVLGHLKNHVPGDASKFVERNAGRIVDVLRRVTDVPAEMEPLDVLASYGVARFYQPCLLSGPVTYRGEPLPTHPFVGIAPEMTTHLGVVGEPAWILTIENLASFNRQVREAMVPNGIAIYTGGFPSEAVLEAIHRVVAATTCPIYHWGDIDVGGLRIARRLEVVLERVNRPLRLHMMSPGVARAKGAKRSQSVRPFRDRLPDHSCVAELAEYLASEDAVLLEQEDLDPQVPAPTAA